MVQLPDYDREIGWRLVGGDDRSSGFIQVYNAGTEAWSGVCTDGFDNAVATTLCTVLGFQRGLVKSDEDYDGDFAVQGQLRCRLGVGCTVVGRAGCAGDPAAADCSNGAPLPPPVLPSPSSRNSQRLSLSLSPQVHPPTSCLTVCPSNPPGLRHSEASGPHHWP